MNKAIQHKKLTRKNENNIKNYGQLSNDSLHNLLVSIEKYKYLILKSNINSILLVSPNATVINCINHVISEFGEESLKRQHNKSIVKETGDSQKDDININNLWTEIIIHLQEILVSNKVIDNELYGLILTMIAQVHERQSLKITSSLALQDICLKLVAHLENVDMKLRPRYLRCLASFILGNLNSIQKELFTSLSTAFFKESEKYLSIDENTFDSLESLKYCVSGLTNLCYMPSNLSGEDFLAKRFQICGRFLQIFMGCLEKCSNFTELSAISRFRMQHQCLHGLNYVSQRPHGLSVDNIERFLEVLRVYCGFGLFRVAKFGEWAVGGGGSVTTENEDNGNGGVMTGLSTGDNYGMSDTNYGGASLAGGASTYHCRPMRKWEMKTRRLSLELLLKILDKSWKKVSTSIWIQFMPLGVYASRSRFHLVNMLEREPDSCLRSLILQAIEQCISGCRDLLVTAQHQPVSTVTFVSRSQNLASALVDVHMRLLDLLTIDKSCQIRLGVLKCLVALIRTAPYHRLKSGLIASIVTSLRQLYLESEPDQTGLRCAILDCFTGLVSLESVSQDMHQLLLDPPKFADIMSDSQVNTPDIFADSSRSMQPSWLVQLCVRLAHPVLVDRLWTCALSPESWGLDMDPLVTKIVTEGNHQTDTTMRCQALMTVSAMLARHSSLIRPSLDTLKRTLLACLDESLQHQTLQSNAALRSHVLRVFSGFLSTLENKKVKRYLGIMQDSQDDNIPSDAFQSTFFSTSTNDELVCDWWSSFLQPVIQCLQDENDSVRRSAAQCLCFMCEPVLEFMMDGDEMKQYWSVLLSMFRDPCTAVSCQAIWSLGYWVAMRPLNTDEIFIRALVSSCVDLCEMAITDCSMYLVCANAAWTLSNVIEVLVAHKEALLPCCKISNANVTCGALVQQYFTDFDSITRLMRLFCDLCALKKAGQVAASARIHENAIRGLGYLCRFINDDLINDLSNKGLLLCASETFCKAVQLPDKAGRVKIKWNACLSASHVFHNHALIVTDEIFGLHQLIESLVTSVANDRYFKVRNNSLVSLITLIDSGGRPSLSDRLFDIIIAPLANACLSVNQKSTIPFSEVHRHCLCLYLLHFTLLKLIVLFTQSDLDKLASDASLLSLLTTVFSEQLPSIWHHLRNLNRSFNKQALLTQTLMLKSSVSATVQEVDILLSDLREHIDTVWVTKPCSKVAIDMLEQLYLSITQARFKDDDVKDDDNSQNTCDPMSDDDGLMTKRPGTSFMFSQIYD